MMVGEGGNHKEKEKISPGKKFDLMGMFQQEGVNGIFCWYPLTDQNTGEERPFAFDSRQSVVQTGRPCLTLQDGKGASLYIRNMAG